MLTPSGKLFIPPMEFARIAVERNKQLHKTTNQFEDYFLRQTGRTTNMVINALNQAKSGFEVVVKIHSHSHKGYIKNMILHYAHEMKISPRQVDNISFVVDDLDLCGKRFDVIFVDNAVYNPRS
jgi:hypothetical protein